MAEMVDTNYSSGHVYVDTHVEIIDDNYRNLHETNFMQASSELLNTDELLLRLPSRKLMSSLGSSKGSSSTTLKKKKTVRSRSLKYRTIRMPRNANSDDILQKLHNEDVMDGDGQMTDEGKDVIRSMPVSLSGKIQALERLSENQQVSSNRLKYSTWFSSSISSSWNRFKRRVNNLAFYTALWKSPIKKIKGHFGTSVTSYFLFLKWLFLWNFFSFFLAFCFQVLPQLLYRFFGMVPEGYSNNTVFTGKELLTGKGWLENTELYYGFYTNESIQLFGLAAYNMPYAYFVTSGLNYLLLLIIIAYSIANSYKTNYVEAGNEVTYYFVTKLFCGWDYGITSKDAAILSHKSIGNEFKEHLTKFKDDVLKRKVYQRCRLFFWRLFTHIIILGLISGSGYLVFYLSNKELTKLPLLEDLVVPICISAANALLPFIFSGIAFLEQYEKPKTNLYITMVRNMLLKVTNISMLCYYWYQKIFTYEKKENCWETFISQEIYRLVLVDFFFSLLFTLWFEICWALLHYFKLISRSPEFNIAANTLDLIYSQTLCWLGLFYSPLMPLMMAVKLFIIFYVKWLSVLKTCVTSNKTWHAARTHTIFLGVLLLFFTLTAAVVTVSIYYSRPSADCGPFRNYKTAYDVVAKMLTVSDESVGLIREILEFISKPGFIALILVALSVCAYYSRIVLVGHREMVKLLKYQLSMEGQDKVFLLKLLNQVKSGKIQLPSKTH